MTSDEKWMALAIEQAKKAYAVDEVPVGAVLVLDGQLISSGHNQPIAQHDPTAHAEIVVLRKAGSVIHNYRLLGAELYVTLEPCAMCVGAIHHARIKRLITGANDPKTGCTHSLFPLLNEKCFFHKIELTTDVCAPECAQLLKQFFIDRR